MRDKLETERRNEGGEAREGGREGGREERPLSPAALNVDLLKGARRELSRRGRSQ